MKNRGDHTESIRIEYDPKAISYEKLLDIYWKNHDPTSKMKKQVQHVLDFSTSFIIFQNVLNIQKNLTAYYLFPIQYTSLIFYHDEEQKKFAEESFKKQEKLLGSLITEILPATTFYDAEE